MSHVIGLFWIPGQADGEGYYQIRCQVCGRILVERVEIKDDCQPVEWLGIHLEETITAKEKLG